MLFKPSIIQRLLVRHVTQAELGVAYPLCDSCTNFLAPVSILYSTKNPNCKAWVLVGEVIFKL